MFCPNCGTNIDDRASFCPECGARLNAQPSQESPFDRQPPQAPVPPQPYRQPPQGSYRAPIAQRSIGVAILLSIVTCGIYGLYWLYCLVTDLNAATGETENASGGMVILLSLVTCNIYLIYWCYKAGQQVNRLHALNGQMQDNSLSILYLILALFGLNIVNYALIQNELNQVAEL